MKCPRCLCFNEEHADRCVCGFPFSLEGDQKLSTWFDEVRHILQSAYIVAPTPWQQSGIRAEGFNVTGTSSGFDGAGKEKCRVVMLQP